jgi:hypothetical protein
MLVAGCSSNYYRVTDPASGNVYYRTNIDNVGSGAVQIKDEKTGNTVTLQSSEVREISEGEYQAGLVAKAPAKPASDLSTIFSVQPAPAQK